MSAVMSCGRGVDKRLVLADTLMWTNPDSSLAILEKIDSKSLKGKENQAYYALLLTQAQFRCNIPLTSDTLISKAVEYYSDNHNREHYTRSLLYKGGAYEDMGNPVEAIKCYKQAADNADSTDYRNLAQINFRMGMLYFNSYASNNLDLNKFKMAAHYYEKLNDKIMLMQSLYYCANVLRITDNNEARKCYDKALSTARELKDTTNIYSININYALMYLEDSLCSQAKRYILDAYRLNNRFEENNNYYMMSLIYANQKDIDSAKYFISLPDKSQNTAYDSLLMYKALKEIALCENNLSEYRNFSYQYNSISNFLEHNETKYKLHDLEQEFDKSTKSEASISLGKKKRIISFLIGLLLLVSIVFLLLYLKKKKDAKRMLAELKRENFSHYEQLGNSINDFDSELSEAMGAKLEVFEEIMTGAYNPQQDYKSNVIAHRMTPIDDKDTKFWNGLFAYLNYKHDGIMDKVSSQFPQLTVPDLNFIALMCCDFSSAAIAVCKGYRNIDSVRSRRMKIRDKMGIEGTLTKYIATLKTAN